MGQYKAPPDNLVRRVSNILLGGRTNLGLTMEGVREAGLTEAASPTVSKWEEFNSNLAPLLYAIRLARADSATREALADLIGVRRVDTGIPDEHAATMVRRVMVARKRADWPILRARLDEILPELREEDVQMAREELARMVDRLVAVDEDAG